MLANEGWRTAGEGIAFHAQYPTLDGFEERLIDSGARYETDCCNKIHLAVRWRGFCCIVSQSLVGVRRVLGRNVACRHW